jgi:hypothetical protein
MSKMQDSDVEKNDVDENKKSVANEDSFSQVLLGEETPAAEIKEPAVETEEKQEAKPVPETETGQEHTVKDAVKDTVKENELPAVETEEKPAVETEEKPAVETDEKLKRQAEEGSVADDESPDKKNKTVDVVVEMETDATVPPVIAA